MPRPQNSTDVFSAIADPRRRQIIAFLRGGEGATVGSLVDPLQLPQPAVSKHLSVLRKVGVVTVAKDGQRRIYRLNASELKQVYDWAKTFERFWESNLQRIKARAEIAVTAPFTDADN